MSRIELQGVNVRYGAHEAVKDLSFSCMDGGLTCILGPSGAGKTSTLKAIAGIIPLSSGKILIDGKDVSKVPSQSRRLAMTFEGYNLYPHFTVYQNLAFPLQSPRRSEKYDENTLNRRVHQIAKMLEIDPLLNRYPKEISGGQRQRVGLGRMLVREDADAYLLDEPIAHLDAKLRHQMVGEINRIHSEMQITMVYATPDSDEAIALADVIVFINKGRAVQIGIPEQFILRPATMFVAEFVGEPKINFLSGTLLKDSGKYFVKGADRRIEMTKKDFNVLKEGYDFKEGQQVHLGIRAQYCNFSFKKPQKNYIDPEMRVCVIEPRGDSVVITLEQGDDFFLVKLTEMDNRLEIDSKVWLTLDPSNFHIFNEDGNNLIRK